MTATIVHETEKICYEHIPDADIHTIRFYDDSREAYDQFIGVMDRIYEDVTVDDVIRILVDYRQSGVPNITYTFRKGMQWANGLSVHPEAKMAIVMQREFLLHMFSRLIDTMRFSHLSTRFFEEEDGYQDALAWLREE